MEKKIYNSQSPLLKIDKLSTYFDTHSGLVKAVDGVDINLYPGDCLGVVGESGSGKSVTFLSVMGLIKKPGRIASGSIKFNGQELTRLSPQHYRKIRGKEIAMTLQDALTALNPSIKIINQISEVLKEHDQKIAARGRKAIKNRAVEMMKLVGIPDAQNRLNDYPHQFSGGMRQRIMIAIALACKPKLLIADEPTTALDVTIQAQVLNLIADIRKKLKMSVIIITHNLGVVSEFTDKIVVMYAGQVVESGFTRDVILNPRHPYSQGLLKSIPRLSELDKAIHPIPGQVSDLVNLPDQCRFFPRCSQRSEECRKDIPIRKLSNHREVRCIKVEE
ncbi:MAG: ABC transporter ATP-binding protein [Desulfobacula sp.]|uniref:ABC transporter ATP-binding protein n=1 Tax=Desulfobacula sp. TaxID=2593537 RepID=UPI0025B93328|nr:ABC transporter ATP-binding protein [Desulfobacula sp.]MCD4720433.1 ABC transporter ATP-binding protein [Desulfobacula sp.]